MTIPIVALSLWRSASSEVRHLRLVVGAIAFLSSILILDLQVDAQTSPPATGARKDSSDATAVAQCHGQKPPPECHFEGPR